MNSGKTIIKLLMLIFVPVPSFMLLTAIAGKMALPIACIILLAIIAAMYFEHESKVKLMKKRWYNIKSSESLIRTRSYFTYDLNSLGDKVGRADSKDWKIEFIKREVAAIDYAIKLAKKREKAEFKRIKQMQ